MHNTNSNPPHNPALLNIRMNLEPVTAINTCLYSADNLLRISLLLVLALRANNNQDHGRHIAKTGL